MINQCCGLNENGPHRLICLNAWSPVVGTVWEGLGVVALMEKVCHWGLGFEVSKALCLCLSLFFSTCYLWIRMYSSQLLLRYHACVLPTGMIMGKPSKMVGKPPIILSLIRIALLMVSLLKNRTVTKTMSIGYLKNSSIVIHSLKKRGLIRTRTYPRCMNWLFGAHSLWRDTLLSLDTERWVLVLSL